MTLILNSHALTDTRNHSHTCECGVYRWPHHMGIGKCNVRHLDEPVCAECHQPTALVLRDFGIGPYEFWGQKCIDINKQWVTECCECDEIIIPRDGSKSGIDRDMREERGE